VKETLGSDTATAHYIFNEDATDFLTIATRSGTTFQFLKALLILPQDQTATNVPPYVNSSTGFLSTDPLHPVFVKLTTQARGPPPASLCISCTANA
jgi:hypothetical protein